MTPKPSRAVQRPVRVTRNGRGRVGASDQDLLLILCPTVAEEAEVLFRVAAAEEEEASVDLFRVAAAAEEEASVDSVPARTLSL